MLNLLAMTTFEKWSLFIGALTALGTVGAVIIALYKSRKEKKFRLDLLYYKHAVKNNHDMEIINSDTKSVLLKQIGIRIKSEWVQLEKIVFDDTFKCLPLTLEPNQYIALDNVVSLIIDTILKKYEKIPKQFYRIELYYGINQKKPITRYLSSRELKNYYQNYMIGMRRINNDLHKISDENVSVFRKCPNGVHSWEISKVDKEKLFFNCNQSLAQSTCFQYVVIDKSNQKAVYTMDSNESVSAFDKRLTKSCLVETIPQQPIQIKIPKKIRVDKFWRIKYWFESKMKIHRAVRSSMRRYKRTAKNKRH